MKNDLFKCILANEFTDTEENVKWLVDNDYMTHFTKVLDGFYYIKRKDFDYIGYSQDVVYIKASYLYEK